MLFKKVTIYILILVCFLLIKNISFGATTDPLQMEKQEYEQELKRIESWKKSFTKPTKDLKSLEIFGDEIQAKWSQKTKEYYAKLMLQVCKPISSWYFNDVRQATVLARKYALSALADPNKIPLETELELIGHVMTDMVTSRAPKNQEWAQIRKKDVEVRFHAWKRLLDAIDPNWDPNDLPSLNISPPVATGLPSGVGPEAIKDPNLRAEYEAAIEKNRLKAERYSQESRLRTWLKRFPSRAEKYIVDAYSKPPFDVQELKQYLDKYIADTKTKARILDAVRLNMENQKKIDLNIK
jgi:hypothetical protein